VRRPRTQSDEDAPTRSVEDVDRELDAALARPAARSEREVNFKRQWDDDLEAELQEALEGFDASSLTARNKAPRTRAQDRAHVEKADVGQEGRDRPGTQKAKVVAIRGSSVFVDMGAKSEGVLPLDQFGDVPPTVGQMLDVVFEKFDAKEGLLKVSLPNAAVEASWENLRTGVIVDVRVTKVLEGKGLEIEAGGIRGFMPISQIELDRVEDLKPYLNERLRSMVTEANRRERNLVVSRRSFLDKEREEKREKTWKELEEGQTRTGTVRSLKPFGAFVDLGGVDGLIPIGEMAWGRIKHPSEIVSLGMEVEVKILKLDRELNKVTLGLKQLKESPWDRIEDRFSVGEIVKGKVTRLMDFGAFVELESGLEGLIHISELSNKRVFRVKDFVSEGQDVDVKIVKIDHDTRRIGLSMRIEMPKLAEPETEEGAEDDTPPATKPERKVPLKGGLGDRDPNPFAMPPK
jgi:small subunit ribosomal protein S1